MSVLGFCYFNTNEFSGACTCYEELVKICPEVIDYQHHLAQCLFKVGRMDEALEICDKIIPNTPALKTKLTELKAAILYEKNEFQSAITALKGMQGLDGVNDLQNMINEGCIHFKME